MLLLILVKEYYQILSCILYTYIELLCYLLLYIHKKVMDIRYIITYKLPNSKNTF